jgi:hypothetical protein
MHVHILLHVHILYCLLDFFHLCLLDQAVKKTPIFFFFISNKKNFSIKFCANGTLYTTVMLCQRNIVQNRYVVPTAQFK